MHQSNKEHTASAQKMLSGIANVINLFFRRHLIGFGTALECMDGRVQGATRKWTKRMFGVRYVDIITQPGINKVLAENTDIPILENIKTMLWISIKDHGSRTIVAAAHHNCAGNPNEQEIQIKHLRLAEKTIRNMIESLPLGELGITSEAITIALLWINERWMPEAIPSKAPILTRIGA